MKNLLNSQCDLHPTKICEYMCSYTKCSKRLICEECRKTHLQIHASHFIYQLSNLASIHAYNKVDKLKEVLVKEKLAQESTIRTIYGDFDNLVQPLMDKVKSFRNESQALIEDELVKYLKSNKFIIDETANEIHKSDTKTIKNDPNKMLDETIAQAQIVNRREGRIIQNGQGYKWYSDTTKEMSSNILTEIKSMINVCIKLISNSIELQRNKYNAEQLQLDSHHDMSFYRRFHASNMVGVDKLKLESDILQNKNMLNWKDGEIVKSKKEIREKVVKISELEEKIDGLTDQLLDWQQKKQREERERKVTLEKEKKSKEEMLIKQGIIGSNGRSLNFERKEIDEKLFPLLLQLVKHPISIDLSNHRLTKNQLQKLLQCNTVQIFKFNFAFYDEELLIKFLQAYPNLYHLELNSLDINDVKLEIISRYFNSNRLKILYLIDNQITDEGLQNLLKRVYNLEQLFVSYNQKLTAKCIDGFNGLNQIKVLHIAKTQLKPKGAKQIAKTVKSLEQLFIGSTGIQKEGILSLTRGCLKLKRLSLVANQISTEVVTEILLNLKDLIWLDLSYCNLNRDDIDKIQKLKIFNKNLTIIYSN